MEYSFTPSNLTITEGFYYDQVKQRPQTYDEALTLEAKTAIDKQDVIVGGIKTQKYIDKMGDSTTKQTVILKTSGSNVLWISMSFPLGTDPTTFNQILSTFTFTNQNQATDTSNWKTYTSKYFTFKYPSNWTDNTGIEPNTLEVKGLRISPNSVFEISASAQPYETYVNNVKSTYKQMIPQTITVDSQQAVRFDLIGHGEPLPVGYVVTTIALKGSNGVGSYSIVFNGLKTDVSDELINQVLSTIQFTQ